MDLGIAGRAAIVCASSKGLGTRLRRGTCARRLPHRRSTVATQRIADAQPQDIRAETGAEVMVVVGDLNEACGARSAVRSLSGAGYPGQQQWRAAAARISKRSRRDDILKGVESNMITPIALAPARVAGHGGAAASAASSTLLRARCARRLRGLTFPRGRGRGSPRSSPARRGATPDATSPSTRSNPGSSKPIASSNCLAATAAPRRAPRAKKKFPPRRTGSAAKNSASSARFSPALTPATSSGRIFSSTAAAFPGAF